MDSAGILRNRRGRPGAVILQDKVAGEMSMLVDGVPYLNYNTVKDSLNSRFYWDSTNQLMLYTTPTDVIKIPAGGAEYTVSDEAESFDQIIVRLEGETPYIEADFVKQYTNMTYEDASGAGLYSRDLQMGNDPAGGKSNATRTSAIRAVSRAQF